MLIMQIVNMIMSLYNLPAQSDLGFQNVKASYRQKVLKIEFRIKYALSFGEYNILSSMVWPK